uniref:Immunoglobulin V-set domain-containing protein n=1 Tax=Cynoglossus semilaevis TaxID=244447 RepID=A0A3P8V817_CYNSE
AVLCRLLLLLLLLLLLCEDLTLDQAEQFPSEGSSVTLTYKDKKEPTGTDYFFWYRQDPGKAPEFLVSVSGTGAPLSASVPGLSATVKAEERKVELQINSAAVRDSAVYYCCKYNQIPWM